MNGGKVENSECNVVAMHKVEENFVEFLLSTMIHQLPDAMHRYNQGTNPNIEEVSPFHTERKPEIGETSSNTLHQLERMQSMIEGIISSVRSDENFDEAQIAKEVDLAYKSLLSLFTRQY